MGKKQNKRQERPVPVPNAVKKETMWVVAFVCLIVGFIGGSAFTIYKSQNKAAPAPVAQAPQGQAGASGDMEEQIRRFQAQTKETPDNAFSWIGLGNSYFDTGRYNEAVAAYEKALALDPNHADVWTDLGVMYRRTGNPKKAVECFDKAVEIDPQHQIARFNKGIVLMHDLKDSKGAIASWESLLKINPDAKAPDGQPVKTLIESSKKQSG